MNTWVPWLFILTVPWAGLLFLRARFSLGVITLSLFWLGLTAALALSDFYLKAPQQPPRMALLLGVPLLGILLFLILHAGRDFLNSLDYGKLMWVHTVRIPVEIVLWSLVGMGLVPEIMSFEGRNFDILAGLTAPLVWLLTYGRGKESHGLLLVWHLLCLGLLLNIIVIAILSTPLPIQQFGFEQPNIAVFVFPYHWLAAYVAPLVLFAQVAAIRHHILALSGKKSASGKLGTI